MIPKHRVVVLVLARLLAVLPLAYLHRVGALCGWLVYFAVAALSPLPARQSARGGLCATRRCCAAAVAEAGKGLLELPAIWLRPHARGGGAGWCRSTGWELVEARARRGAAASCSSRRTWAASRSPRSSIAGATRFPITVLYRAAEDQPGWSR